MYHRIRHQLPTILPLVSIVICTRDHEALLSRAVESIRTLSTYPNYELVIVDNGSRDPQAVAHLAWLATQPGIQVIRDDSPFNYSRLNNGAVAHCRGEVLCLLNDDIEVVTSDWLEEMVSFVVKPDVGAVGARLWYPDGTLQHGGVIIGAGGVAGHAHLRLPKGSPGYFGRAVLQQELSAVTGACLMVRRGVFQEMGGLDEQIAVAFNDIDFCLRLRAAGYRNIWTPFAELIHHESASRGPEDYQEKIARFQREIRFMEARWGDTLACDPHYSPNLSMQAGLQGVCGRTRRLSASRLSALATKWGARLSRMKAGAWGCAQRRGRSRPPVPPAGREETGARGGRRGRTEVDWQAHGVERRRRGRERAQVWQAGPAAPPPELLSDGGSFGIELFSG
jgi:GT2 family glycosyltransferase